MPTDQRQAPFNLEAEESVLGAMILSARARTRVIRELAPSDFFRPAHSALFSAIVALYDNGHAVDEITLSNELKRRGALESIGGSAAIINIQANTPSMESAPRYAQIVREHAALRRLLGIAREAQDAVYALKEPNDIADGITEGLRKLNRGSATSERFWRSTADYLAADKTEVGEPVIPSLIGSRGRTIVLATEKAGKSTLLRQMAECMASGLHPWTFAVLPAPIRVLVLDVENDDDELEPTLRYLDEVLSARLGADRGRPALLSLPWTLDLRSRAGRSQLEEVLDETRPQVIVGGPVVNLYRRRRGESEDEIISDLKEVFNDIRYRWGAAWVIEHHSKTDRTEGLASKGGQAWDAWANATIGLYAKDGGARVEVRHQHPPRGRVVWPRSFIRGTKDGDWPWIPSFSAQTKSEQYEPPERAEQRGF